MDEQIGKKVESARYRIRYFETMAEIALISVKSAIASMNVRQNSKIEMQNDNPAFLFYEHYFELQSRSIEENEALFELIQRKIRVWKRELGKIDQTHLKYRKMQISSQDAVDVKRLAFEQTEEGLILALEQRKMQPSEAHEQLVGKLQDEHIALDRKLAELSERNNTCNKLCDSQYDLLDEQLRQMFDDMSVVKNNFVEMAENTEKFDPLEVEIKSLEQLSQQFDVKQEVAKYFASRTGIVVVEEPIDLDNIRDAVAEVEEEAPNPIEEEVVMAE